MNVNAQTAATSALAMFAGSGWTIPGLSVWTEEHGTGIVETYNDLGAYAALSAAMLDGVMTLGTLQLPGVWAYEVDEVFGKAWAFQMARLGEHEEMPDSALRRELGSLAYGFLNRPGVLSAAEWETAKALIKTATGFSV